jgi:RNA polymerase sigma factor (TIGR02999 family)
MLAVYGKLRALAGRYMKQERSDHTLQPTALVHEAYLALVNIERVDWKGKVHFYAMAARQMRRVLVGYARRHKALKRGGRKVTLKSDAEVTPKGVVDPLLLDLALEKLAGMHPRQAEVVELRYFAGLREKEVAHVLGVSERTVRNDWVVARAWLARELGSEHGSET